MSREAPGRLRQKVRAGTSTCAPVAGLAKHEWARLKSNHNLECRNCHSSVAMDLSRQAPRAAGIQTRYLLPGEATCIDCHKGIAHELPKMEGVDPGWKVPPELQGEELPQASVFERLERFSQAHAGLSSPISLPAAVQSPD